MVTAPYLKPRCSFNRRMEFLGDLVRIEPVRRPPGLHERALYRVGRLLAIPPAN